MKSIEDTKLGRVLNKNKFMRVATVAALLFVTTEANHNKDGYSQAQGSFTHKPAYNLSVEALRNISLDDERALMVSIANSMPKITAYKMIDSIADIRSRYVDYKWTKKVFKKTLKHIKIHSDIMDTAFVRTLADQESGLRHNPYLRHNPPKIKGDNTQTLKKPSGARGMMELVESAWYTVDKSDYITNVYDPKKNLINGVKLLEYIERYCKKNNPYWDTYDKRTKLAEIAAGYNAGLKILVDNDWDLQAVYKSQTTAETRKYVAQLDSQKFIKNLTKPHIRLDDSLENKVQNVGPSNDSIASDKYISSR